LASKVHTNKKVAMCCSVTQTQTSSTLLYFNVWLALLHKRTIPVQIYKCQCLQIAVSVHHCLRWAGSKQL